MNNVCFIALPERGHDHKMAWLIETKPLKDFLMKMISCQKCKNNISPNAFQCPQCGERSPRFKSVKTEQPCRICGKLLKIQDHIREEKGDSYTSYTNNEGVTNSYRRTMIVHTPCPYCGETRPLRSFWLETFTGRILLFIMSAIIAVALLITIFAVGKFLLT